MPKSFVIDVSDFSRYAKGHDAPIWWGIVGLILIEISVVSAFTVSYLYLQMTNAQWPPVGVAAPDLFMPTTTLMLLLISGATMTLAGRAIDKDRVKTFIVYTFTSVALAFITLAIRWNKLHALDFRWDEHVYGSLVWTITGFHFTHVVSAAIGTAVIGFLGLMGYFNSNRQIGVVVDTMYWNFVALAWIPFYLVLYWAPRWF